MLIHTHHAFSITSSKASKISNHIGRSCDYIRDFSQWAYYIQGRSWYELWTKQRFRIRSRFLVSNFMQVSKKQVHGTLFRILNKISFRICIMRLSLAYQQRLTKRTNSQVQGTI